MIFAEQAQDISTILTMLNQYDDRLIHEGSDSFERGRVEIGLVELVTCDGDPMGYAYNEIGPGCWMYTSKHPFKKDES